jgi:hypothetical protein
VIDIEVTTAKDRRRWLRVKRSAANFAAKEKEQEPKIGSWGCRFRAGLARG